MYGNLNKSHFVLFPKGTENMKEINYTAKILKIAHYDENLPEITSPYRESKDLPPVYYDTHIEAEIISVNTGELSDVKLPRFLRKWFQTSLFKSKVIKTSFRTTIGFRSPEDAKKYRDQDYLEKDGQDVQTIVTLYRLRDLNVGELIRFFYLNPESCPSVPNLIRYQNEPLIIDNFKNKSYPSRIDNTLEDSPIKHDIKFIGLCRFEKVRTSCWKQNWFRLEAKYPFLINIKQELFYKKRSTWKKVKIVVVIISTIVFLVYRLYPNLLNNPMHRLTLIVTSLTNMLKDLF